MAKLPRETVQQFGVSGAPTAFGQFGSKTAAAPQTSQNPSIIMQLAAWATGWTAAAVGAAFNPYLEDMNGFCLVVMYFLANIFERGIPDWDAGTTYYAGAVVQDPAGSGQQFYSLTDNNLGNALPLGASNGQWRWNNPPASVVGGAPGTGAILKVSATAAAGGTPGSKRLDASLLSDDGTNIVLASGGIEFPDTTIQTTAAVPNPGPPTVASPPSGYIIDTAPYNFATRALGTIYKNTGNKPRYVTISGRAVNVDKVGYCDGSPSPSTVVFLFKGGTDSAEMCATFIVLPGYYYKIIGGTSSYWTEWT